MSLVSSMYTAANGLTAHSDAMNVVSDNIANVSTVGYKSSEARFADVIATTPDMAPNNGLTGQGSHVSGVEEAFTQGALLSTGGATDIALEGDGFFILSGSFNGVAGQFYTRAGQFHLDKTGTLVNFDGLKVQGYSANALGVVQNTPGDLTLQTNALIPPNATANVSIVANLDSQATTPAAWDVTDASGTSNWSNNVTMYDTRGAAHSVTMYYRNTGTANTWEWHAVVDGGDLTGGTAGTPTEIANGTLAFDTEGSLNTQVTTTNSVNFINADNPQTVTWSFGDPTTSAGTGKEGITSYATPSTVTSVSQDGYTDGALGGITIGADGTIVGSYDNGVQQTLGQLTVARFRSDQGLERIGGTLWIGTEASGDPAYGAASTGGRGSISSGSLEQSNVNLSQEFIHLMQYQRGFEANTRTLKASDQMLQEMVNIAR